MHAYVGAYYYLYNTPSEITVLSCATLATVQGFAGQSHNTVKLKHKFIHYILNINPTFVYLVSESHTLTRLSGSLKRLE